MIQPETEDTICPEYKEALAFLYSFVDYERSSEWNYDTDHFNLSRVLCLLKVLGNPHRHKWFVHIAGTNGKGSVAAMISSALIRSGLKTGLYTSPHLISFRERIRINGAMMPGADLIESVGYLRASAQHCEGLTFFEVWTALAFDYFARKGVDMSVIEVGMGGRLDSTNVIIPAVSVITSISMDHKCRLGDTLEKIAYEKAGIFRAGKVGVFGDTDMPDAIAEQAQKVGAHLWCLGKQFSFKAGELQWDYQGRDRRSSLPFPALRGAYQLNNASTALAVLEAMKERLPVSMAAVRRGLTEVELPGRFQVLPGKPVMILDVAHNPHAARSLARTLGSMPPCPKTYAVCAMLKDKDMAGVVRELMWQVDVWLVAGIAAVRGATADELANVVQQELIDGEVLSFATVTEALHHASKEVDENDRIVAFGSFYTVAEAMRAKSA